MIGTNEIAIMKIKSCIYPDKRNLFRPSEKYPEYIFGEYSETDNQVYYAVREALHLCKMDNQHYGTINWNPFGEYIKPGMTVLIKPNLVMDYNRSGAGTECLFTHPSLVAPVVDYIVKALNKNGKILIADAPVQECNFKRLIRESGYQDLVTYYKTKGIDIELLDFRGAISSAKNGLYNLQECGDENGKIIDLGENSEFYTLDETLKGRLRITNYAPDKVSSHHRGSVNEYMINKQALQADVIINMPKPKTHRIAGITASLKNFVGINVRKEFLPHHIKGSYRTGGDESDASGIIVNLRSFCIDKKNYYQERKSYGLASIYLFAVRFFSLLMKPISMYREGCWYGNKTISKTVADINKIIYFADKNGVMTKKQQRTIIIISDMIVSGEGEGPMTPTPKKTGIVLVGTNPLCVDEVVARIMGFSKNKIPTLNQFENNLSLLPFRTNKETVIFSNDLSIDLKKINDISEDKFYHFKPADGWKGHIEL